MYGYDLAWLPVFVSNTCKIDINMQNLKILWQALWEELQMFAVSLPPSLTKQKTGSNNNPRTELLPLMERSTDTYICQIQCICDPVLGNTYFFFFLPFFFLFFLAENFTLSSPRQSGQTVCNFRSPYSKSNPFAIDSALLCKFQHKGSLDFSLMKNKKINPSLEKEGSLNQTALVTQATKQHPNV